MNFNSIKETKAYNIGFENGFNKAQNDIKNLENTMLQENAANEKRFFERKARDAQRLKEFKTLERALCLIQQKIARSKLSDEQQKILIEEIDVAITRFEKLLLV